MPATPSDSLLRRYLLPQWRRVVTLALLMALVIALELLSPQILRRFVDDAAKGSALEALVEIALMYLAAAVVLQLAAIGEVWVAENIGLTATNWLRADLALHVLRLDPPFHAAHTPGELIERIDGDVATLGNFFSRLVVNLFCNALLLVGIVALLFAVDWRVGLAGATCVSAGLVAVTLMRRLAVPRYDALRQANAELFGLVEERLAGTEDVRANGGVGYVIRRLLERSRRLLWAEIAASLIGSAAFQLSAMFLGLATAAALAVGSWLFLRDQLTIGTVYLIFAYTQSMQKPIQQIGRQLQDLQQALASIGRVRRLLAERSTIVDGPGAELPPGALAVELDAVTFGYGDGEAVLRDVSLRVGAGQVLGLLGRTGSGKTTAARLLFRLYDPGAGAIRVGGVDLRQPPVDDLRARIGVVTQDIQLFHASVRDNVTFFDDAVPAERVLAVLAELGLEPWLRSLPDGIETRLASGGGGLSAGEAQLLAFARVFLKDPSLVILDEASSRLDPATERLLERAVDRLLKGRTAIVIAHRLATVERADRIAILDEGRILEEGDRAALAADPRSQFSQLLRAGLQEVLV